MDGIASGSRDGQARPLRLGFFMDQVAGHITNYRNLRAVADTDTDIDPSWREISYRREGGTIERVRDRWLPFVPTYFSGNLRAGVELHQAFKHDYDAIFSNARVGVFFARQFRRTPTMLDFDVTPVQLDQMPAYGGGNDPAPLARLKKRLCHDMFHAAGLLQAWSHWAKQSAVDDYGVDSDKVVVNPPGVDLSFWRPAPERAEAARRPRRVLFVGGDFQRKGGELLLDWHAGQDPDDVELHLVTRDPVPAAPGRFVYDDMAPNTDRLLALYHDADLFVMPSLGECFGIATVEAMAAGLPVIGSDVGGTADIIEPGGNGYITRAGDGADLAEAIAAVLDDEAKWRSMGARSRALAEERFDLRTNARRTLDHLKQLVPA